MKRHWIPVQKTTGMTENEEMTNDKSQTNHNDKNSKLQTGFDHWILRFEICLGFEY
jgi:hypothetical protein